VPLGAVGRFVRFRSYWVICVSKTAMIWGEVADLVGVAQDGSVTNTQDALPGTPTELG
jgi:hypothetical protein